MGIYENFSMALASIRSNKLRSFLTMLGIIIGIAAVIAIQTVGGSLTNSVSSSMSGMGANNITVQLTQKSSSTSNSKTNSGDTRLRLFMNSKPDEEDLITDAMIEEYMETFPDSVDHVELSVSVGNGTIAKYGDPQTTITAVVQGVNDATFTSMEADTPLLAGRWIDESTDANRNVCVVSEKFVEQAVGGTVNGALGKKIVLTINNQLQSFYIEGVYAYEEDSLSSMFGESDDSIQTNIYIPLALAKKLSGVKSGYQSFTVVAAGGVNMNDFLNVTGDFFSSFYLRNDTWTVKASSLSSLIESLTSMVSTISMGISGIAAIALLVGGIGVMNIMTVSVTERTREIGTRKALGAPGSAIRAQFITESIVLCAIGGIIGVALGIALGSVISKILGYAAQPSLVSILIAVGFSMAIGVFFGYYPANRAAKMDPIEALRYE